MTTHVSTAPHQSRKKRELTRIIEAFKYQNSGEIARQIMVFYYIALPTLKIKNSIITIV